MKGVDIVLVEDLVCAAKALFAEISDWTNRETAIIDLLQRTHLKGDEINRYTFWDYNKTYTRNLISTNNDFSLLLLCWNPGKESKIHNHPCNGCFVKTVRGCLKETRYIISQPDGLIKQTSIRFCNEGQQSMMRDNMGLHKIGNPLHDSGAISIHLYSPPFDSCKVWDSVGSVTQFEVGKIGFYSTFGHPSPALEGKAGARAKLMKELITYCRGKKRIVDAIY